MNSGSPAYERNLEAARKEGQINSDPPDYSTLWREHPWHSCHQGGTFEIVITPSATVFNN